MDHQYLNPSARYLFSLCFLPLPSASPDASLKGEWFRAEHITRDTTRPFYNRKNISTSFLSTPCLLEPFCQPLTYRLIVEFKASISQNDA